MKSQQHAGLVLCRMVEWVGPCPFSHIEAKISGTVAIGTTTELCSIFEEKIGRRRYGKNVFANIKNNKGEFTFNVYAPVTLHVTTIRSIANAAISTLKDVGILADATLKMETPELGVYAFP